MTDRRETLVEIDGHILNETDMAVLISPTGLERDGVWLPLSKIEIENHHKVQPCHRISMPGWMAESKGLI